MLALLGKQKNRWGYHLGQLKHHRRAPQSQNKAGANEYFEIFDAQAMADTGRHPLVYLLARGDP